MPEAGGPRTYAAATALVHEAYLRLVGSELSLQDRAHFLAIATRVLRHILVDYAKAAKRQKRGGSAVKVEFDKAVLVGAAEPQDIVDQNEALERLALRDERKSNLVELLFFGGLTYDEAAAALHISPATVHRELSMAKAWLRREMTGV